MLIERLGQAASTRPSVAGMFRLDVFGGHDSHGHVARSLATLERLNAAKVGSRGRISKRYPKSAGDPGPDRT